MSQEDFEASGLAYDAIIRNLEVIVEASKARAQGNTGGHPGYSLANDLRI